MRIHDNFEESCPFWRKLWAQRSKTAVPLAVIIWRKYSHKENTKEGRNLLPQRHIVFDAINVLRVPGLHRKVHLSKTSFSFSLVWRYFSRMSQFNKEAR